MLVQDELEWAFDLNNGQGYFKKFSEKGDY
jgi:hypothetical protein